MKKAKIMEVIYKSLGPALRFLSLLHWEPTDYSEIEPITTQLPGTDRL